MLLLALSCLRGRSRAHAWDTLGALGADGLQLTTGVTVGASSCCLDADVPTTYQPPVTRLHHGFTWHGGAEAQVWTNKGELVWQGDAARPPRQGTVPERWNWIDTLHTAFERGQLKCVETMYPSHTGSDYTCLDTGWGIEAAMRVGFPLAVNIAHLAIQRELGLLTDATWKLIQDYDRIVEIYCSDARRGRAHYEPLTSETWGLAWAREQLRAGTCVVLHSQLHRLSEPDRRGQLNLLRG